MDFGLELALSGWLLALLLLISAAYGMWIYRYTTPVVRNRVRVFLLSLRLLSIAILILLIFEPVLSISRHQSETPVLAVLVDNSASIGLPQQTGSRAEEMRSQLRRPWLATLDERFDLALFKFSDAITPAANLDPDSITFDGDGTNLPGALLAAAEQLSGRNFAAAVLLSDGVHNVGPNPETALESFPVPVHSIGIGSPEPGADIWIEEILSNAVAYADTEVPVEIVIRSTGFAGRRVQLQLEAGGTVLKTEQVQLPRDGEETKVTTTFVPPSPGLQRLIARLPAQAKELTAENNTRARSVTVLKSKLKILIVAGSPGPDLAFLRRALESDENLSVEVRAGLQRGRFPTATLPNAGQDVDCLILIDPEAAGTPALRSWIDGAMKTAMLPALFVRGTGNLRPYNAHVPLVMNPGGGREIQLAIRPTAPGLTHPILRVRDDVGGVRESFGALPPVFGTRSPARPVAGAQVLLEGVPEAGSPQGASTPILAIRSWDDRKAAVLNAGGFWRWHALMQRGGAYADVYSRLMLNLVRWLVSDADRKLFRLTANRQSYRSGEEMLLTAQAYFEDFTPRDNLDVRAALADGSEILFENKGRGVYEGRFATVTGGVHTLNATAQEGDIVVGRDELRVTVEPYRIEYQRTAADPGVLRAISTKTGGSFLDPDSLEQWASGLQLEQRITTERSSYQLWSRWPMLLALVLLLSLEWFVRKRKGML